MEDAVLAWPGVAVTDEAKRAHQQDGEDSPVEVGAMAGKGVIGTTTAVVDEMGVW